MLRTDGTLRVNGADGVYDYSAINSQLAVNDDHVGATSHASLIITDARYGEGIEIVPNSEYEHRHCWISADNDFLTATADSAFVVAGYTGVYPLTARIREGTVGIGTLNPQAQLDINGDEGYAQLRLRTSFSPTNTNDSRGNTGDLAWDDNYIYMKTSAGWKRAVLSTF